MKKVRTRITPISIDNTSISYTDVMATEIKTGKHGFLSTEFLPRGKYEEMVENGFAYTNQYSHRFC